jgi:hypothetical protein
MSPAGGGWGWKLNYTACRQAWTQMTQRHENDNFYSAVNEYNKNLNALVS